MKHSSRSYLVAAAIAGGVLVGAAQHSPAAAGSLDWLGNDNYVRCLKYVSNLAKAYPPNQRDAAYDRGRRSCNRAHFPNRPGTDY